MNHYTSGAAGAEEIYEELTPTMECALAVAGLIPQRGKTRLVLIEGPTGAGKSTALDVICRKYAGQVARVEAHEGWKSLAAALRDILVALGARDEDVPNSANGLLSAIVARLKAARRLVAIDEGHHCTACVLNAIKTILNLTDSVMVVAGIDTLWRKLTSRNWEEARQLIHNRLYERVRLGAPGTSDVRFFFERRLNQAGSWEAAAGKVAQMSAHCGHYAFLRRVADRLNSQPDPADAAAMLEAAEHIKRTLETR